MLASLKITPTAARGIQAPDDPPILLIPSIDSLRSPFGLSEVVFLRSASILSKNQPPPNPLSQKQ
jgi:hypothetical protein